jgi:hypothetical protein
MIEIEHPPFAELPVNDLNYAQGVDGILATVFPQLFVSVSVAPVSPFSLVIYNIIQIKRTKKSKTLRPLGVE